MPLPHEKNFPNEPLSNLKHNVHKICGQDVVRVQADIDRKVYDYFFLHTIAYTHGSRQAIIAFFFQKFYDACRAVGIPPVWDETSAPRVLELLNKLNFNNNERPQHTLD